ncbi:hypothetical protein F3Y22_tig00015498pilonHSYRG00124 [Hibiscus syriacus]|uniref:Uncharacterized protein n=1 Tax=Hibiscus syriacus TaxID=106335 RepID=A0A6A3BY22_HIBSY|nr:hypothetical protein F3Y22_tig00015498pilonHSYRG00124 [Hibiscus syriacus]
MATSNKTHKYSHLITSLVFFFFFFFVSSVSLSSARLLSGNPSATQPTLNLGLPVDVEGSDKPDQDPKSTALPCDHMVPFKNFEVGVLRSPTQKLAGKYGPMFLSMLPKGGQVPSSGPSKGSNDIET